MQTLNKTSTWGKYIFILGFFLLSPHVHADSFQNIPISAIPCTSAQSIGDLTSGTCAPVATDLTGRKTWDISSFEASSTWKLAIITAGSASSSVVLSGRYVDLWYRSRSGTSPFCAPYISDASGNIYGTSTPTANAGTAVWGTSNALFTSYVQNYLGNDYYMTLCQYDTGSAGTHSGLVFQNSTSTGNGILNSALFQAGPILAFGGMIYAVYSTASSTEGMTFGPSGINAFFNYLDNLDASSTSKTHIVSFTPLNGQLITSSSSVPFNLTVYVHPRDVGSSTMVEIDMFNIDQNAILQGINSDFKVLLQTTATSSGYFTFSTSTPLAEGNYRVRVSIGKLVLYGFIRNPFSDINDTQDHQFIVGHSTFLGNISQSSFTETQAIFNAFTATDTMSLSGSCNVLSGFDTMKCLAFLFIPSADQMSSSLTSFRDGILSHAPWGYVTRVYTILSGNASSSLPAYSVDIPYDSSAHTVHFEMDMNQAFSNATNVLDTTRDPIHGKNLKDIAKPLIEMIVAFAVLYEILTDIMGSHKHANLAQK